jgi:hypothetical protein
MATPYFYGPTLDDVMHDVVEEILSRGERIYPSKGGPEGAIEIAGVMLEISNPRARLSRTETRGRIFVQVLEDGLCNWQKSPDRFVPFRG